MKSRILPVSIFSLMLLVASTSFACSKVEFDVTELKSGGLALVDLNGYEAFVYRRTPKQIEAGTSEQSNQWDSKLPEWWPKDKTPVDGDASTKRNRSHDDEYFVAWNIGPVYGYDLIFFPDPTVEPSKKGTWPAFLGSEWLGGFVDVVHMVAYDFNGRVHSSDPNIEKPTKGGLLRNIPLLVPKYSIDKKTKVIEFECLKLNGLILDYWAPTNSIS